MSGLTVSPSRIRRHRPAIRFRKINVTTLAAAITVNLLAGSPLIAGVVIPHEIKDMILVGQAGPSRSTVTRSLLMVGDHLYCSGEPGVQTIDASDPGNLVLTDDWTASSAKMNGAAAKGNTLYVTNWYPPVGLVIFDIASPAHPRHVRTLATGSYAWDASIFGDLMYLSIGAETDSGISTYDIAATPDNPAMVGTFMLGDRLCGNAARFGDYLYFTHKEWLYVYNASNPASPFFVRTLQFNTLCGNVEVRNGYLYMLGRGDGVVPQKDGGLWVFSLTNPANPAQIEYWSQLEPRDMHFQKNYCVIPASGSGVYTLDVSDPANVVELANWGVSWPGAGSHGGYAVCVTGSGNHVFIGTTSGNNSGCEDYTCAHYGARVYSVRIAADPPIIAPVEDHPVLTGFEYNESLSLTQGDPAPTWQVVSGPPGLEVDATGHLNGWTPGAALIGQTVAITVRAANQAGADTESWQMRVRSRADFDHDDDVDQVDFGYLQRCLSGDGQGYADGCQAADLERDQDVDQGDFNVFRLCIAGADQLPGC